MGRVGLTLRHMVMEHQLKMNFWLSREAAGVNIGMNLVQSLTTGWQKNSSILEQQLSSKRMVTQLYSVTLIWIVLQNVYTI